MSQDQQEFTYTPETFQNDTSITIKQNKSNIFNKLRNTQEIERSVEDSNGLPEL